MDMCRFRAGSGSVSQTVRSAVSPIIRRSVRKPRQAACVVQNTVSYRPAAAYSNRFGTVRNSCGPLSGPVPVRMEPTM